MSVLVRCLSVLLVTDLKYKYIHKYIHTHYEIFYYFPAMYLLVICVYLL